MIYRNGKKYMLMKNGRPYQEAYSSITPTQLSEIKEYMKSHEGETLIAENGNDWVFKFEPFPENIIQYIKKSGNSVQLRYSYRGKSSTYGVAWMCEDPEEKDILKKSVPTYDRKTLCKMLIPAVNKWNGKIGYTQILCSPMKGNEGEYPVAVKLTAADLRKGEVTLPFATSLQDTRFRDEFYRPVIGKLSLIFNPEKIHLFKKTHIEEEGLYNYETIAETAIMESKTVVTKNRNKFNSYQNPEQPWVVLPNAINAGGTRTKTHSITIIHNDLYELGIPDHAWICFEQSCGCRWSPDNDLVDYDGTIEDINSVKFEIYSTYEYSVLIRSKSMGWSFKVPRDPIPPSDAGSGASTYTSPTIGLTQDVDDLEILLL